MISGGASVEALIPGSVSTITRALETAGAGVGASRQIGQAWEMVSVPSWKGQAAAGWAAFVPREQGRVGLAPAAFNRVASVLMQYEAAFIGARAQAQAAIEQARAAEQASANARQEHRTAVSTAALADPGTAAAATPVFRDPGRAGLASAQAQLDAARQNLQRQGDEVAADIRAAAGSSSGEAAGIEWWDHILQFPNKFIWNGVGGQLIDTLVGIWELLPYPFMIDDMAEGETDGVLEWLQMWGGIFEAVAKDPGGAVWSMFLEFIAAEHWDGYAGEGVGRVAFNIGTMGLGAAGVLKSLKSLGTLARPGANLIHLRTLKAGETPRIGTLLRGTSDGGPGLWTKSPKRTKGVEYQEFITQMERGTEYKLNGINFDGYDKLRNVLLDAKNWDKWPPANKNFWHDKTILEMENQLRAARGTGVRIEWHFSSQAAKDAVDKLLALRGMTGEITTVFTPFN